MYQLYLNMYNYHLFFQGDGQSLIDRFGKLSSVVKSKSVSMKAKMINYIKNEPSNGAVDRCVVRRHRQWLIQREYYFTS